MINDSYNSRTGNQSPNYGKKGYSLEYLVAGLFQSQGYLSRRSIPLQYGPVNQDATDVDVLGIQFTLPFKGHRIICDCKNKQRSRPYERIFWAKGLGEFTKASEVYVALPKPSPEIINFALTGGVRVLTHDKVNQLSNTPLGSYGIVDEKFYQGFFIAIEKNIKNDKLAEKIWLKTRKLFLSEEPYTTINIAIDFLYRATKQLNITKHSLDHNLFWKYLCCELVVLIGLQILWICSDTYSLFENARKERILSKLTYGKLEPSEANNLLNSVKDLANEIIRANVPKSYLPSSKIVNFGELTPPQYAHSIIGLVERALRNPQWYVDVPQLLDFLLFEQGLKGKDFCEKDFHDVFRSGLTDEKLKALKNILSFIKETVGFEWVMISSKQEMDSYQTEKKIKSDIADTKENIEAPNTNEKQTTIEEVIKEQPQKNTEE